MKTRIAVLTAASLLLVASASLAASGDVHVRTTDANPGGEAYFLHTSKGLRLKACDIQKGDGYSAWAYASYNKQFQNIVGDTNGGGNSCATRSVRATKGRAVYVTVCIADRDGDNVLKFCSPWKRGRA
jgi:hypothetical protein